jgi:hypothetical protein
MNAIRLVGMLPAGESRMEWVLRLVETGMDGQSRSSDVMVQTVVCGRGRVLAAVIRARRSVSKAAASVPY